MIEYKGLPLFGEDSNPRNTSKFIGLIGTGIVWFIFLICMIIIRPAEKEQRKYKDVQIVFEALPPLPEPPPEPVIEEPVVDPMMEKMEESLVKLKEIKEQKQDLAKSQKNTQKSQPNREKELSKIDSDSKSYSQNNNGSRQNKTSTNSSRKEGDYNQVDMTNPIIPDKNEGKTDNKAFDWSVFDDEPADESAASNTTNTVKVNKKNEVNGVSSEAVASNENKNNTSTQSQEQGKSSGNYVASAKTKGALKGIRDVQIKGNGGNSEISFKGGDDDGGYFMTMGDGGDSDTGGRGIISPKNPTISLSSEAIKDIKVSASVYVKFTVLEHGNVVEVSVSPASSLPPSVVKEIKEQVSSWRFRDTGYKSHGEFKYSIKVN